MVLTYGGDFGDRPTDGDFSGNGIAYGGKRNHLRKCRKSSIIIRI